MQLSCRQMSGFFASSSSTFSSSSSVRTYSINVGPSPILRHRSHSRTYLPQILATSVSLAENQAPVIEAISTLDKTQLKQLATSWGYDQLGTSLPPGITTGVLSSSIPEELTGFDLKRLLLGLIAPFALMTAGYFWMWYMHSIIPAWQQATCWIMIGTGYFGLFNVAHDAARMALLPDNLSLQSWIGSLIMAPSLYSLEAWRASLFVHYNMTNILREDEGAWRPITKKQLSTLGPMATAWARLISTTPLKLLGSIVHWIRSFDGLDLKQYYPPMRVPMIISWSIPFLFMGVAWPALICMGGVGAWFDLWFMPWIVFHVWLSFITLLHHTAPHVPFVGGRQQDYDAAQAILNGTVTVTLPRWLEFLINYANYHLPQHLRNDVPFYHAKQATEAIRQKLGPYLTETKLSGRLVRNLVERWQVYDEDKQTYIPFQKAVDEIRLREHNSEVDMSPELSLKPHPS
ncbi:hypothetical protein CEUSTIGMA_g2997.t1 [Chlamydomonas eustigma]|uniref:Fatty acid desaturase domain-containing protein n=1 Tax=Chlamydomonas eustigma TaxID=1157962 RepID=A0A250WXK0_9CHLO|nr:hypothetical protein CEUSTIGMA_g2997.t1 [Chlamydomonas eustigma]|eukprot:GAX75554.1 hypothetical protein CEUSTIGMA_g2997.t1 [Chlamydomonas eustigma]